MKKQIRKQKNNLSFVILIFVILKFRNPSRSTFDYSIFSIPPKNLQLKNFQKFLMGRGVQNLEWSIAEWPIFLNL